MPFESQAQRRLFYARPELHKFIPEFESATHGPLPQHVGDAHMAMNPLAALLGHAGGPPNGQHSIQVNPPSGGDPTDALKRLTSGGPGGPQGGKDVSIDSVISDIHALIPTLDDEQDKATAAKCLTAFQGIKATEQKEKEAAMGTTPAHKFMAKQQGSY